MLSILQVYYTNIIRVSQFFLPISIASGAHQINFSYDGVFVAQCIFSSISCFVDFFLSFDRFYVYMPWFCQFVFDLRVCIFLLISSAFLIIVLIKRIKKTQQHKLLKSGTLSTCLSFICDLSEVVVYHILMVFFPFRLVLYSDLQFT